MRLRSYGAPLAGRLRKRWGAPDCEDELLLAWRLPRTGELAAGAGADREHRVPESGAP